MSRVLVTGAASGVGLALARRLTDQGVAVIGVDRAEIPVPLAQTVRLDLTDFAAVRETAATITEPLDGIANVAGVPGTAPAATVLGVNVVGTRVLTEALLPRLAEGGAVVTVASIAAHRNTLAPEALAQLCTVDSAAGLSAWLEEFPLSGSEAYNTSKAALVAWSARLAARLLPRARAVSVSPGPVCTPILADFRTSMGAESIDRAGALVGRHAEPGEVAAAAAFLLGPGASWVNGIDLPVEGGLAAARAHLTESAERTTR
ncbi:SDR family oxidoreductase [Amycolatopsis rhabdoformis]|uniref:SDR family oxidoreductase n=1 Tax=Amycolatopsis rhabdoformis TaxID=1448059 RepID=A0ABZ1IIQ9_9PSEU|nr:SDR family oxidoreductase [Amycolatopsis rhabdoformis]WSE34291.1 SDR family oxidoreductase [Amycolatopsis rhabdoformis]